MKDQMLCENEIIAKHHFLHMVNQVFLRVILSCEVKSILLLKQKSTKTSIEILSTTENKAPDHSCRAAIHSIYLTAQFCIFNSKGQMLNKIMYLIS